MKWRQRFRTDELDRAAQAAFEEVAECEETPAGFGAWGGRGVDVTAVVGLPFSSTQLDKNGIAASRAGCVTAPSQLIPGAIHRRSAGAGMSLSNGLGAPTTGVSGQVNRLRADNGTAQGRASGVGRQNALATDQHQKVTPVVT
jgi:hypothetical protein